MTCLICGAADIELLSADDFVARDCPLCGYYGIPKLLLDEISVRQQSFHVERTRSYLSMLTENNLPPWITHADINTHQLFVISTT